jgi:hypothetical protein
MVDANLAVERKALRARREMLLFLVENLARFGAGNPEWHLDVRHVYRPRISWNEKRNDDAWETVRRASCGEWRSALGR